jgi:hypothetical protein
MYLVNNTDQIHHLTNELKKLIFTYNSDRREYLILLNDYKAGTTGECIGTILLNYLSLEFRPHNKVHILAVNS